MSKAAHLRRLIRFATVALAAAACAGGFGPDADTIVLRTDRTAYWATYEQGEGTYRQYGFRVVAQLINLSHTTVYLARCYPQSPTPTYGVTLVDGDDAWGAAYDGVWACVGHDQQIAVPSRGTRVDTLHVRGPNVWSGATGQPYGALTGLMQLHYEIQACRGDGACRLRTAGASNVFRVELAP